MTVCWALTLTKAADARDLTLAAIRISNVSNERAVRELPLSILRVLGQRTLVEHETVRLIDSVRSSHATSTVALTSTHGALQVSRSIILEGLIMCSLAARERLMSNESRLGLLTAVVGTALAEAILVNLLVSRLIAALRIVLVGLTTHSNTGSSSLNRDRAILSSHDCLVHLEL